MVADPTETGALKDYTLIPHEDSSDAKTLPVYLKSSRLLTDHHLPKVKEILYLNRMTISCLLSSRENKAKTDTWILYVLQRGSQIFSNAFSCIDGLDMTSSKHDCANYDEIAPNLDIRYKTIKRVFVTNLKLFGVMGQRSWRICYYVVWENGLVRTILRTNMAATR